MSKEHLCFDKMYDSKKGEKDLFRDRYETFLKNVCRFIRRRSLFMAAMLKLAVEHEKLYKDLMERICVDEVINGQKEVFEFLTKAENELRLTGTALKKFSDFYEHQVYLKQQQINTAAEFLKTEADTAAQM